MLFTGYVMRVQWTLDAFWHTPQDDTVSLTEQHVVHVYINKSHLPVFIYDYDTNKNNLDPLSLITKQDA
jgi:hypothetical protein